ncbi:Nucleoside-diphosphate-sugar epimerase [Granulicella pectinivorans]|uniref:Nucleoside-diphosphate-sugar epimerase n=1 Tax=Granulicella pectinivorans TaxID=474950 RepID=A0A1I6KZN3_9BACT|nr:NAD-dependent epimerase/dehydratase family protein [Granulicella pectinivorans]SFR96682.1 Nucleoside-diphosphate-sugar epimerase [Granulicella pectinivorans]
MNGVCAVTGANGYVGSHIAALLASHFAVVPMGRKAGSEGIVWQMGDNGVGEALRSHGVTALVHSAWDMTQTDAMLSWETNVEGTRSLIAEAKAAGVERIVFISTISCFEEARSNYGKTKLAAEKIVIDAGGTVIRPGLVWGERAGGMFGSLRKQVSGGGVVPMVGSGLYTQFLVHEEDLAAAVLRALEDDRFSGRVLTVAHPKPWMLRDLVLRIASEEGKQVKLVSVPWRFVYFALKSAEKIGLKLSFRSDSLLSMVYSNPKPAFSDDIPVRSFS